MSNSDDVIILCGHLERLQAQSNELSLEIVEEASIASSAVLTAQEILLEAIERFEKKLRLIDRLVQ